MQQVRSFLIRWILGATTAWFVAVCWGIQHKNVDIYYFPLEWRFVEMALPIAMSLGLLYPTAAVIPSTLRRLWFCTVIANASRYTPSSVPAGM